MSNSSDETVRLPEVKAFSPLDEKSEHSSEKETSTSSKEPLEVKEGGAPEAPVVVAPVEASVVNSEPQVLIGKGGCTLTVPGAEALDAPFIESVVSNSGQPAEGPLITMIGEEEPVKSWKRMKKPLVGASIAANMMLLMAGVYFVGFSGSTVSHETTASILPTSSSDYVVHRKLPGSSSVEKNVSLVDHFQEKAPSEPLEGLKPRRVKIETFHVARKQDDPFDKSVTTAANGAPEDGNLSSADKPQDIDKSSKQLVTTLGPIAIPRPKPDTPKVIKSSYLKEDAQHKSAQLSSGSIIKELQALRDGHRTKPITIVHVGDSHISSDAFSQGIRDGLQAAYGNAGRGAVVPASAYKYARADGVRMTTVGEWSSANSLRVNAGPYGLSGVRVASSSPSAKMLLSTTGEEAFDWAEVTVLTGPQQGNVTLAVGDQSKTINAHASSIGSKVVRLEAQGNKMSISPAGGGKTTVLNWATGREVAGIRYVNFGISSATAYLPKRWDRKLVANDIRHLDPDLVVWGYGTNEGFDSNLNMTSYRNQVEAIYTSFSEAAPRADWLFIGPASGLSRRGKAAGYCGGYRIPAKLSAVSNTLEAFAKENGRHFWNWSEAMGGPCAVDRWARATPKLAAGDRVHLTVKGYRKSADALVAHINDLVGKPQLVASVTTVQQ